MATGPQAKVDETTMMVVSEAYTGAGVLPFAVNGEGRVVFLVHRTFEGKKVGKLIDFGGATESSKDKNSLWTAIREFNEETGGLFSYPADELLAQLQLPSFNDHLGKVTTLSEHGMQVDETVKRVVELSYAAIAAGLSPIRRVLTRGRWPWPLNWLYVLYLTQISWRSLDSINQAFKDSPKKRREFQWVPGDDLVEILARKVTLDGKKAELLDRAADAEGLSDTIKGILATHDQMTAQRTL